MNRSLSLGGGGGGVVAALPNLLVHKVGSLGHCLVQDAVVVVACGAGGGPHHRPVRFRICRSGHSLGVLIYILDDGWMALLRHNHHWMVPPTPTPHRWMAAESTTQLIRIHSRIQVSPVIVLDVDDGCGGENGTESYQPPRV